MEELEIVLEQETDSEIEIELINEGTIIYPTLENLEVVSTGEKQVFNHPNSYGYDNVVVKPFAMQEKVVAPIKEEQVITADSGYSGLSKVSVEAVTNEVDSNITPENIRSGASILGVTGNFVGKKYAPRQIRFSSYTGTELNEEIANLDTSNLSTMSYMFDSCSKLTSLDVSNFNTSKVTNMSYMFNTCSNITSLDVSNFVTNNVTNMSYMFSNDSRLTSLDVSNFVTNNVTNMSNMFNGCANITSLDVSNFDTSKVTNMSYMFNNCYKVTSLDLSNFDAGKVTSITYMLGACYKLTSLIFMSNLGKGYTNKTNIYNSYKFDLSKTTLLDHDSLMNIINKLYDLNLTYGVANGGTLYTQALILGTTNLAKLTAEEIAIATNKGWTVS